MKTELKAKFLQHLLGKKKEDEGFTLIELLVVIIIIGILSAIALPSFINQAAKAKQTEAKTTISSVNKAQQTQRIENGVFATSITNLSIGLTASSTANYDYTLTAVGTGASATITASAKDTTSLKGYGGGVFISTPTGDAPSIICQTTGVQGNTSSSGLTPTSATACPSGMEILK
ncbi:type IV pilin-like G/H family protein [Anabaena sp. FACHB-1237]|uniref:type IV pilin-like G/H family protein n=1 Tax=Anabaena sp. FACHB-1237 TaxID=2692769 RepID=UPI00168098A5|nr:type IV pilin-like G/H family protein [Anabaena sp. FACHB-1237]MBD2139639.1 type IV pilin-like G/H family protein [Anabaena sp. FACHB-1237]